MSGLQARGEDTINGVDVREQGSSLRVATNTPHLVSLGTGRLSTAVTLHPIKQGRVTIGSDPTCDMYVVGTGVASVHCRVENSHGVVTLYPTSGSTLLDGLPVDKPTRLSQGSMLTIGRSNYLRFNHPEEAKLMKSVLPAGAAGHVSMAPVQFTPNEQCVNTGCPQYHPADAACRDGSSPAVGQAAPEVGRVRPPVPRKPSRERDSDDNSDQESRPKVSSIMAKVSKFEYYAKQQKNYGRSQFYTTNESEISPKVFSSNSLTVNTPAKDVLGKNMPNYIKNMQEKVIHTTENNSMDPKKCSYQNVAIRNKNRIEDIVRNFDDNSRLPKKVNNDQHVRDNHIYGKINNDSKNERNNQTEQVKNNSELRINNFESTKNNFEWKKIREENNYAKVSETCDKNVKMLSLPSPAFDRNPQYSPVYANCHADRSLEAEHRRIRAFEDRIKEEEQKEAETARLEEILNMCAEYERQIASGIPITPTEKRAHNKIITNGSLPRSVTLTNPNFVQTSDGYYKFETTPHRNTSMSQSLPIQRNLSHYENFTSNEQPSSQPVTPEVTIKHQAAGRMDEIGIPVFDTAKNDLSSPIMIRKIQNGDPRMMKSSSPIGSPYENVYYNRNNSLNLKPKSPNTQSPRSRIKTTFAHKNLPSPQYFVFPTPPPKDNSMKPNFNLHSTSLQSTELWETYSSLSPKSPREPSSFIGNPRTPKSPKDHNDEDSYSNQRIAHRDKTEHDNHHNVSKDKNESINQKQVEKTGIEKQLSLEEEIPMIDDSDLTDNIEFRVSKIPEKLGDTGENQDKADERIPKDFVECKKWTKDENQERHNEYIKTASKTFVEIEADLAIEKLPKNKSFDDVKKELMADIPELEEFEQDLIENKREKIIKNITADFKKMDIEAVSIDSVLDDNLRELKGKYERLREERKKLLAEIHEIKCKMTEIRSQEDDILRELEMEKALIKGEYDSEIAILNIEQKKRTELLDRSRKIDEDIKQLKDNQDARQKEMRDRVEIATLKVERIEKDIKASQATLEELQNAQDILDNETKMFEDLEFQHLEKESELLSNREDMYNEITRLTKKIDTQKQRILTLKSEANENLTSALDETKDLQAEYVRLLNHVEHLTGKVQTIETELKPLVSKLNDIERTQSPDSAFFTDQTRAKSGEFGYSPQTSDSDDLDITKISEDHNKHVTDKFNSIDRMSQSMIVEIERRVITDIVPINLDSENSYESPTKTSLKEKKGFWERNFDSLKRKKKPKSPEKCEKTDIMSQSLNENIFYNNETIEYDNNFDRFNSLRHSKNKKEKNGGPIKSISSSKIPTFAALGKIIKKDSFGKKSRENTSITIHNNHESNDAKEKDNNKNRYVKNVKPSTDNKYVKAKCSTPDKVKETINEENEHQIDASPFEKLRKTSLDNNDSKLLYRKSCGDEPNARISEFQKISDSGKIPSQDDIDRISKVTMDAPLFSSDTDMNSLGKRTLDSLMEIERKRMEMLEEQGCQVIENEREKIIELKRRAQDETKKMWDQKSREKSLESDTQSGTAAAHFPGVTSESVQAAPLSSESAHEHCARLPSDTEAMARDDVTATEDSVCMQDSVMEDSFMSNSMFEDSSGLMSASSIEELQIRNSRTESTTEDDKRSDDSRPLSHASDFSRDNTLSLTGAPRRSRRGVAPYNDSQRPLTRYLPVDRDDFDLRRHVESAGHQIDVCPYVTVTASSCRGYLHKLGAKFHTWSKRWFVFDRETKTFVYYWDKSEKKPRGGAYFQVIEEVYLDHGNTSKSPSPQTTFIVKTRQRRYYLMAPSGESARIWIDVIFTGAQGYTEYLE